MNRTPTGVLLQYLRTLVAEPDTFALSDRELLHRFAEQHDEAAFTMLVRRHGPMVLRLCQRLLQNGHDAEDACQATFLILASKAASRHWQPSVASWLHRVAYYLARKAKAATIRRSFHERHVVQRPMPDPLDTLTGRELLAVLDEELNRLPEKYRTLLVLCYLEGVTRAQAVKQLGCALGTLKHRLERGRELLRVRLVKRGVALPAALSAPLLLENSVNAELSGALWARIAQGAVAFAGIKAGMMGTLSVPALDLAERTLKAMAMTKLKVTAALLLAVSALAGGVGALAHRMPEAEQSRLQGEPSGKKVAEEKTTPKTQTKNPILTDRYGDLLPAGAIARIGTNRLRVHNGPTVIAFSQDGRRLAYGNEDGLIHVEAADGEPVLEFQPDKVNLNPVTELAFSPDGRTLAAGGYWYEALWLIDLVTRKIRHTIPNTAPGQNLWGRAWQGPGFAFTPDGGTLVVGGKDGALHFWDPLTGTERATLGETTEPVLSLTLTANGRAALTAHRGGALHLWDVPGRKHLRKLAGSTSFPHVYLTALSPDGKTVALAPGAAVLELWDPDGGRRHQLRTAAPVVGLSFTPDGASLLVADGDGCVTVWDVQTGKKRKALACEDVSLRGTDGNIQPRPSAWFRSDGKVMAWGIPGVIRAWDLTTGQESPQLGLYREGIHWAGFSADGRLLRVGGVTGELDVWDAATCLPHGARRKIAMPPGARFGPHYLPASDRGKVVAVTSVEDIVEHPKPGEGQIFIWDPTGNRDPVPLREQVATAWYATLTPDNCFVVATEAAGQLQVYDAATGKPTRSFKAPGNELLPTFSPDGALLATRTLRGVIRLYDFATGRVLRELKGLSPPSCLAFAPDGRSLASGHMAPLFETSQPGDMIYLWDKATGQELRRIPTGHGNVLALSFSPDGRLIAACGSDRVVQLWETISGQERRRYEGHRSWVQSVDFAPDGSRLASASLDGTAVVWQVFDPAPLERFTFDLLTRIIP
jgi:RNA polymerase sigma factor (sigma-70 family)